MADTNKEAINSGVASSNARMKDVIDKTHNNLTVNQNYDATPNKVLTYKDNAEWFDNKAVWREGMSDRESENVRRKVMSGGYGFNPKTGVTYKLDKKDRVNVSEETKELSKVDSNKDIKQKTIKSGPHFKYKDVDGTEHLFKGTAEEFKGSEEEAAHNKKWVEDTKSHANKAFANVTGTLIPAVGAYQAATNIMQKSVGRDPYSKTGEIAEGESLETGDFIAGGLSALPFIPGGFSRAGKVPAQIYKGNNNASTPYLAGQTFAPNQSSTLTQNTINVQKQEDKVTAKNLKQKEKSKPTG